jgi:hypothetical protein
MQQFWSGRVVQAAARYGDNAPMAAVCCNACRTCVQTNLIGVGLAAIAGGLAVVRRLAAGQVERAIE